MARVEFKKIIKRFEDGTVALKNFSLTIEDGEFVVLVGPSGCGKSTVLRLLAGLEHATTGDMLINGERVNEKVPQQRNIAMVFQNYALYPHMTVRGNLDFPLKMARQSRQFRKEKIAEIAEILDLSTLLDKKPKQLSGGQRQRVAMGRALVRNPSVFLLDEPLSNLDAKLRAQIRAEIATLQRRLGKTTLYVTHDQVEAMTLGDKVALLRGGHLQQVGTPRNLYERPYNSFVAGFIGNPGMNLLPARLARLAENSLSIEVGAEQLTVPVGAVNPQQDIQLQEGQGLLFGVRPEALRLTSNNNPLALRGVVEAVEYLGHESLVYLRLEDGEGRDTIRLIARLPGHLREKARARLSVYFAPEAVYLFDSNENEKPSL